MRKENGTAGAPSELAFYKYKLPIGHDIGADAHEKQRGKALAYLTKGVYLKLKHICLPMYSVCCDCGTEHVLHVRFACQVYW